MSLVHVIITRAEPGAGETARRMGALGLHPIVSPVLSLRLVQPVPDIPADGVRGVLFTSANGVRFFSEASDVRACQAFCVGPATLAAAEAAGFADCLSANGDSQDLVQLVMRTCDPAGGHLLHIANTAAARTVQADLTSAGFDVRFIGLYEPLEAAALSPHALQVLDGRQPACVLIHSAKGASAFAKLVSAVLPKNLTFVCVSEKAAEPIQGLGEVRIAARPNENALLRVLKDWQLAL